MPRYWLFKNNRAEGGPSGYWGDWLADVFSQAKNHQWGGSYSTLSPEVWNLLDHEVAVGDVVVAYQTDVKSVVGFCLVTRMTGPVGQQARKIWLAPIEQLDSPFRIHEHKAGTPLATSAAVNGPVMLRELERAEMEALVRLSGAPLRVLRGKPARRGYTP